MAVKTTALAGTGEATIIPFIANGQESHALYGLVITTPNAAAGTLTFRDSTGGTIRLVIDYPNAAVAPGQPFVVFLPYDRPLYQAAPNNNWTAQASVNASGYNINAFYLEM
jgi:hypothetical protein